MTLPFGLLWKWLAGVVMLSAVMSLLLMVAPDAPVMAAYNATWAEAFHGQKGFPPAAMAQHRFSMGVVGAGVLGWALTLLSIVVGPYRRREDWAWWSVAVSVAVWAGCDLALSLFHGVLGEALFAAAAGVGILLPVMLARPHFSKQ